MLYHLSTVELFCVLKISGREVLNVYVAKSHCTIGF